MTGDSGFVVGGCGVEGGGDPIYIYIDLFTTILPLSSCYDYLSMQLQIYSVYFYF